MLDIGMRFCYNGLGALFPCGPQAPLKIGYKTVTKNCEKNAGKNSLEKTPKI